MASTYIFRANGSATGTKKGTISVWFKKAGVGSAQYLYGAYIDGSNRFKIELNSSDIIEINNINGGSDTIIMNTNRVLRDTNAWYHLVFKVDTTQATEADRVKLYINGVQETSFSSVTYPSQDDTNWKALNASSTIDIGAYNNGGGSSAGSRTACFNGEMSHYHFTDGYAYDASTFGETDSTSGIWKPKASPSVTYGNNGFFLKFENSGNLDLDSSGNNLTFTTSGTLTQNIDTPSNNFVTMNPLDNYYNPSTFTNGNTTVTTPSSGYSGVIGAMGASKGKWYFEFKPVSKTGDADEYSVGIAGASVTSTNQPHWKLSTGYEYLGVNGNSYNNDSGSSYGNTFTAGDIIGVAMDLDNSKLYFSKNGTFQNSGVPTSGSTGTGAISITAPDSTPIGFYLPCCAFTSNSAGATMSFNFGSGYFGTTAVSSGNADANGYGSMEYTVPTGYYTMCTKNIKEFG